MSGRLLVTPDVSSGEMMRLLLKQEGQSNARVFACFDDFTVGPLVLTDPPERLLRIRHRFWCKTLGMDLVGLHPTEDRVKGRPSLRQAISEADHIDLFLGGAGSEQLFLLGFAQLLKDIGFPARKVQVFQYPANKPWYSLWLLNLDRLADRPQPVTLTTGLLNRLVTIWSAICSDSPHGLFQLYTAETCVPEFGYLRRAFDDLVLSYPDERTGLTLADERLLSYLPSDWTKAARVIAEAMIGHEQSGRSFADGLLFKRMLELADARTSQQAIELRGDGEQMRNCEVRITDFGKACLSGHKNLVKTNGMDAWVGGVHLTSALGRVWFRNAQGLVAES